MKRRMCSIVFVMAVCVYIGAASTWVASQSSGIGGRLAGSDAQAVAFSRETEAIAPRYTLETKFSKAVRGNYIYSVSVPFLNADEWEVFASKPVTLPGQRILSVVTLPESEVIRDGSALRQPLFRAVIPANSTELRHQMVFTMAIDAQLYSRQLVERKAAVPDAEVETLSDSDRRLMLRSTPQFDYKSKTVKQWVVEHGLQRMAGEGEVDFARRVFQAIARTHSYEYIGEQDRTASHVCTVLKSDCGGLSALFVAILRSQGVCARTRAGRWANSVLPGQRIGSLTYFQEHIKAEFYAPGVGWVPVDVSAAVQHDTSDAKLRYFGNDTGNFITWHIDSDLVFDTLHFGRKVRTLMQRPSYWVSGIGSMAGVVIKEDWYIQ